MVNNFICRHFRFRSILYGIFFSYNILATRYLAALDRAILLDITLLSSIILYNLIFNINIFNI